jgi:uncharacterized coiled-coil protein SlyX
MSEKPKNPQGTQSMSADRENHGGSRLGASSCSPVSETVIEAAIIELESTAYLNGKNAAQSFEVDRARSRLRQLIRNLRRCHKLQSGDKSESDWADHYHSKLVEAQRKGYLPEDFSF